MDLKDNPLKRFYDDRYVAFEKKNKCMITQSNLNGYFMTQS